VADIDRAMQRLEVEAPALASVIAARYGRMELWSWSPALRLAIWASERDATYREAVETLAAAERRLLQILDGDAGT
jgi:hypothetical protein